MRSIVLFEDEGYANLLPLLYWRTTFELRIGRKIVLDRTAQCLGLPVQGVWTRDWMAPVAAVRCGAPANQSVGESTVLVNGRWVFDDSVTLPETPTVGMNDGQVAYVVCDAALASKLSPAVMLDPKSRDAALKGIEAVMAPGKLIRYPWDIVGSLGDLLADDWREGDATIETELPPGVSIDDAERIHIGERVSIHPTAVLDTSEGPIFISDDVRVAALAVIEGPCYIGPGTHIHPHARLHGGNAIGPVCRLAGEIDGCVIQGYSNKQHAGFLGHAYVGTWVNIGAGATNSDLKNTYGTIRSRADGAEVDTGRMFFGGVIADHVKIGINATVPTGAVFGFAANVVTTRIAPKWVPSFGWVGEEGIAPGDPSKLLDVATKVMARRGLDMTDEEVELFLDLEARARSHEQVDA